MPATRRARFWIGLPLTSFPDKVGSTEPTGTFWVRSDCSHFDDSSLLMTARAFSSKKIVDATEIAAAAVGEIDGHRIVINP